MKYTTTDATEQERKNTNLIGKVSWEYADVLNEVKFFSRDDGLVLAKRYLGGEHKAFRLLPQMERNEILRIAKEAGFLPDDDE